MQTNYYTLWTLLNSPEIKYVRVPIIQRDYAQGRPDEKATNIRVRLLDAFYAALAQQQPLTLDFVYGELQDGLFVPLDGQQRLTTLFLLHWYLALLDGRLPEACAALSKFTYETRSSSREFCAELVKATLTAWATYPTLSAALRDTRWFQPAWERDPTVTAMLTMLDALADRFGTSPGWFERLTDEARPLIGFYFLDMPKVGLTDDLYLKMNARGKPLTDFENWKAEFDLLLQRQGWPDLQAEFGKKMDGDWTDLFWKYRWEGSAVVDEVAEQYLHYLTRMLAYQLTAVSYTSLTQNRLKFRWFEKVYAQRANVELLFRSLDFLASVEQREPQGVAGLLGRLLTDKTEPERIRVFGNTQPDVWRQCLQESNPTRLLQEQVLLFGLLTYAATATENQFEAAAARDLLRVLRNLLERVRQQNDTQLNSNLRVDDLPAFALAIKALGEAGDGTAAQVYPRLASGVTVAGLGRRGIEHERMKAQLLLAQPELRPALHELEDQPVLRGDLHNLQLLKHTDQTVAFAQAVRELWSRPLPQDLLIRAWLTIGGNYAISQGKWTQLGEKFFFGNEADWYTVLTTDSKGKENQTLSDFLLAYLRTEGTAPQQKLQQLITDWLTAVTKRSWRYYFVKYPEMTEASTGYFAWDSDSSLRLLRGTSLKSKHVNPYVRAIVRRRQVEKAVLPEADQWVNDTWTSPLWLTTTPGAEQAETLIKLYCENAGWRLELPLGCTLPPALEQEFELAPDAQGRRWLCVTETQDRIERAEEFIAALQLQGVAFQVPVTAPTDSTLTE